MNTFNRFFVILVCVTTIIFWCLVMLGLWTLPARLSELFLNLSRIFRTTPLFLQTLVSAFGLSAVLLSLLVLAGEFTSQRRGTVRLQRSGGHAEVPVETIATRLRAALEGVDGLLSARPLVRTVTADAVEVLVEAHAAHGVALPPLADRVSLRVQQAVFDEMGVNLRTVRVTFLEGPGPDSTPVVPFVSSGPIVVPSADPSVAPGAAQEPPRP